MLNFAYFPVNAIFYYRAGIDCCAIRLAVDGEKEPVGAIVAGRAACRTVVPVRPVWGV